MATTSRRDADRIPVAFQFGTSVKKHGGNKFGTSTKSELEVIRESANAQLLLDDRHIGRLSPSVAITLGPLIFGDFIRVRTER